MLRYDNLRRCNVVAIFKLFYPQGILIVLKGLIKIPGPFISSSDFMKREGYVKMILWKALSMQVEGLIKLNQIQGTFLHLKINKTHCIDSDRGVNTPIGLLMWGWHVPTNLQSSTLDLHDALKFSLLLQNPKNNINGIS